MKAGIYIRVSTEEQKLKGYSLPDQIDSCTRKAQELGATDIEVFAEEGESGAYLDRPELERLFMAVRSEDIQLVIALDSDRLARDLGTQLFIADEIEKNAKLDFVTYSRGNPNNPEDTMFFQMKGVISQYERSKILQRTSAGRKRKAMMGKIVIPGGWTGHPGPYGYTFINENNEPRLEINEAEAEIVKYIYQLAYQEKLSIAKITERLNSEGIPSPKGGIWHPSPVRRLLSNEVYAGVFYNFKYRSITTAKRTPSGKRQHLKVERPISERIPVAVPVIIDRHVWEAVQESLKSNTIRSKINHQALLNGRIKCSNCGSLYSAQQSEYSVYYRCNGRHKKCKMPMLQVKKLDARIWNEIVQILSNPELIKEQIGNPNTEVIMEIENNIQKLQSKINTLLKHKDELFSLRMEGLINAEDLKKRLMKVESRYQELYIDLSTIQDRLDSQKKPFSFDVDEFCQYFAHRITQSCYEDKLEIIKDLDLTFTLHPGKIFEINWPFASTIIRLEPKWQQNMGFSMTPEIKNALDIAAKNYVTASDLIREAILEAPLDVEYKKAPRENRVYSCVCLTEETYNKVKQLQGTYHESAMRIIEWAIEWHLKQLKYL